MTLVFVSCYLSIHQVPICNELYKRLGDNFHYISVEKISEWRLRSGYSDLDSDYPYVIKAYENEELAMRIATASDVLIIGSAPDKYIIKHLQNNKLTFRCCERFYKNGLQIKTLPHAMVSSWLHHGKYNNKPLYMLCASAYTAEDCLRFNNYRGKLYKWGYFPSLKEYDLDSLFKLKNKNNKTIILWAGRLIAWKHPDDAIQLAEYLKLKHLPFMLQIIGNGEMEQTLQTSIKEKGLSDCVCMLGVKNPEDVRRYMEEANIFLLTSDYGEGWGAVVNEAMNSGCAVVACDAAGSVPFLISDQENGLTYKYGDKEKFFSNVERLVDDKEYCEALGKHAYWTIHDTWNANIAAERLLHLIKNIDLGGTPFKEGPCSLA